MKSVDWTKWSAVAEILSAIAIVVTLAYLAIQTRYVREQTGLQSEQNTQNIELLRQNNELMRAQIEQSRSENFIDWRREAAGNVEIARLLAKFQDSSGNTLGGVTQESIEQLDPVEEVQLRMLVSSEFYDFENLFSQYERGFVSEEYWEERIVPGIRIRGRTWRLLWPPNGPTGRRAFHDEIDRILGEPVQSIAP